MEQLKNKRVLITGGTGSLGTALVKRLLKLGFHQSITVFSRDEDKQHEMRLSYPDQSLNFVIGDVRDYSAVSRVVAKADIVFHAAALKHVAICEANPMEAVLTNIQGVANIIRAIKDMQAPVETVIGVSSDKGCQPVNVYGASKFIQERLLISANHDCLTTRFISVLYGNVISSRGSVIPVFQRQIREGGPVTITHPGMTRFLISLDLAVDTLLAALERALPGEVYIPRGLPAATVGDIANVMIGARAIKTRIIGIRTGEKMHEALIPHSETNRVLERGGFYVVSPDVQSEIVLTAGYISCDHVISRTELKRMLVSLDILPREEKPEETTDRKMRTGVGTIANETL